MTKKITLMWFRDDLRVSDNPALEDAAQHGIVLPVYIDEGQEAKGSATSWWRHKSLNDLEQSTNGALRCVSGEAEQVILNLVKQHNITRVVWNRGYSPHRTNTDQRIKQALKQAEVEVRSHNGTMLWEPWTVLKKDGTPYKVFTPFYQKGCLQQSPPRYPTGVPHNIEWYQTADEQYSVASLGLLGDHPWYNKLEQQWTPGEEGGKQILSEFLNSSLAGYGNNRDFPAKAASSGLSPFLHMGNLSANQVWYAALEIANNNGAGDIAEPFMRQLVWRDFNMYLLFHWPNMVEGNFNPLYDEFPWQHDEEKLRQWQRGNTGVPIVDAGMRELWQTGTMHNRVRMVTASYLVKNLLIDWRHGERWFRDCLVDADLACNIGNWQWVAGSGADAAPYFRVFNPVLQGQKFDKQGDYVRRYCPELSDLPDKCIHNPWLASPTVLQQAGVTLGDNYPAPLVDLAASRQRALDSYAQLRELARQNAG